MAYQPKWFNPEEVEGLDERLVKKLDEVRDNARLPVIITSGLRTKDENANAQGVKNSAHTRGLAVDIRSRTPQSHEKFDRAAVLAGFRRRGFYYLDGNFKRPTHLHIDLDDSLPDAIWVGISK